jgi:hypothetical protein
LLHISTKIGNIYFQIKHTSNSRNRQALRNTKQHALLATQKFIQQLALGYKSPDQSSVRSAKTNEKFSLIIATQCSLCSARQWILIRDDSPSTSPLRSGWFCNHTSGHAANSWAQGSADYTSVCTSLLPRILTISCLIFCGMEQRNECCCPVQ